MRTMVAVGPMRLPHNALFLGGEGQYYIGPDEERCDSNQSNYNG